MAREVITRIWCDPCAERGEQHEGEEVVLPLGKKFYRVALCEVDRKEILDPYEQLLTNLGVVEQDTKITPPPAGTTRPRRNRITPVGPAIQPQVDADDPIFPLGTVCKMPDCGEVSKSEAGLKQHLRMHHHQISLDTYRSFLRGDLKPSDVEQYRKDPVQEDYVCRIDDCGRQFLIAENAKPRGAFAGHLRRSHDLSIEEAEKIAPSTL